MPTLNFVSTKGFSSDTTLRPVYWFKFERIDLNHDEMHKHLFLINTKLNLVLFNVDVKLYTSYTSVKNVLDPDSMLTLVQHWPNLGIAVGLMLATFICPMALWPVDVGLVYLWQANSKDLDLHQVFVLVSINNLTF